jgi:hypothetical protein
MVRSRRPGLLSVAPSGREPRTPGLLGINDAGNPFQRADGLVGDTPGLLGINDWAAPMLLAAATAAPQERQLTFSEHAEKRMWDLKKDYLSQVGSHRADYLRRNGLPDDTQGKTGTDCITYVINVLKYAFEQTGRKEVAKRVGSLGERGTELAAYLASLGWRAHYWNPDTSNPADNDQEHSFSYKLAVKTRKYYGIPLSGYIINYNPTPVNPPAAATAKAQVAFDAFSKVKVAYGLARGGRHTFLCSYGMVYEVHWEGIGEDLYEISPLYDFAWKSGVVVTPPDADFTSDSR